MEYKIILGYITIVIAILGYIPYFRDIFRGKTKPHVFSWFIWGLINVIVFLAQVVGHGGAGSWVTAVTALACLTIAALSLRNGKRDFSVIDWLSLAGALLAILLWVVTSEPLLTVILLTIADIIGFVPTFRKSYSKPQEETVAAFALAGLKYAIALFALNSFTMTTALFPTSLVLTNLVFVAMLMIRRKQLRLKAL
ncbi:MAG: hypothetical protein Q7S01_03735 [bacterium]|nr:hypothetical protein [bacterium]